MAWPSQPDRLNGCEKLVAHRLPLDDYPAPTVQAYHYLWDLGLANRKAHDEGLGALDFIEGPCHSNDTTLVSTKSVAARWVAYSRGYYSSAKECESA